MPLTKCFWCRKYERVPGDESLYEPCQSCKEIMEGALVGGVVIAECTLEEVVPDQAALHLGEGRLVYPTGAWVTVQREWAQAALPALSLTKSMAFVTPEVWENLELPDPDGDTKDSPQATTN